MLYTIIITTTTDDGEQTTRTITTTATDARTAHAQAAATAPDGASVRVYPSTTDDNGAAIPAGIARGALLVARRTAINGIKRTGGNATQYRIEREFAAANARCVGAETAERIIYVMRDYSQDTQEYYAIAAAALADGVATGADVAEQYHGAYLALNKYIHAQRTATEYECSTEFITDGGGDIVAINTAISAIIRGGDKWTPADGGNMDATTAARLGAAITAAMRIITPTQRRIVELTARGYSQRQIADMTGRDLRTVARNIANIRGKVAAYITDNAPEFAHMVDGAAVAAAQEKTDKKREQERATQAERARRYRERKKAEQQARQA